MKIKTYIFVGVLGAGFFASTQLPANLVWKSVPSSVASSLPIKVEGVGGTLWDGFLVGQVQQGLNERVVIRWDFKPLALLRGALAIGLGGEGRDFRFAGTAYAGMAGKGVEDLSGNLDVTILNPVLKGMGGSARGLLEINDLSVDLDGDMKVTSASGNLVWQNGAVTAAMGGPPQQYAVPTLNGVVTDVEGGVNVAVALADGNKPLGELGMSSDGIFSLSVLQRVLTLAGMATDDENKVLLKTQQPLF